MHVLHEHVWTSVWNWNVNACPVVWQEDVWTAVWHENACTADGTSMYGLLYGTRMHVLQDDASIYGLQYGTREYMYCTSMYGLLDGTRMHVRYIVR
jgi:hypothetical protein